MEILVYSILAFALWAVIGHGLWVVVRAVVRAIWGHPCPVCRRTILGYLCPYCAPPIHTTHPPQPSVADDLKAAERLIKYSRFKSWIDEAQQASMTALLDGLRHRVQGVEVAPTAVTSVPPTPNSVDSITARVDEELVDKESIGSEFVAEEFVEAQLVDLEFVQVLPTDALASARREDVPIPVHPLDQSYSSDVSYPRSVQSSAGSKPGRLPVGQRLTTGLLKSFMEQSNIRWIELISAALIVVCSVGLVISLWSTLSSTSRFFPSLVFLLATAAVHGAGQYTLRQWKLRSTSRGILHIGLMLIPLAVLVGILLARRDGVQPTLDGMTVVTIALGTLVYGGLAATASSALFPRRWKIVAGATIVASLTLIPIHFLAEHHRLDSWWAWLLPWPIVVATQLAALTASLSSLRNSKMHVRSSKRVLGMIVQTCFAACVVGVFWALAARAGGGLSVAWWLMLATLSAAWIGWSWSVWPAREFMAGLILTGSPHQTRLKSVASPFQSGLLIGGWSWGIVCAMLLLVSVWQLSGARWSLAGLLLLLGLWWLVHGRVCQLLTSLMAAWLSLIVAGTLALEGALAYTGTLSLATSENSLNVVGWVDWLSGSRTMIMTALSLLAIAVGLWWTRQIRRSHAAQRAHADSFSLELLDSESRATIWTQSLALAGSAILGLTAILTVVASLSPLGNTPYGGNWAPLMLTVYGLLFSTVAVGLVKSPRGAPSNHLTPHDRSEWRWEQVLMPIGQALLLLAVIRLCQTSPLLAGQLAELRPNRAWGVGLIGLAMVWSLAAGALRTGWFGSATAQRANIQWLAGGALAGSILCLSAIWQLDEHFALAGRLGWTLPVICIALCYAWRNLAWREMALLTFCAWLSAIVLNIGDHHEWWKTLGSGRTTPFVLAIVATTYIFEALIERIKRPKIALQQAANSPSTVSTLPANGLWWTSPPHWGSSVCVAVCWILLLQPTLAPAATNVIASLGLQSNLLEIGLSNSGGFATLGRLSLALLLTSGIALTALGSWLGHTRTAESRVSAESSEWIGTIDLLWLTNAAALLPFFTALVATTAVVPPYALAAGLWVLAVWSLLSELLPLLGKQTGQLSDDAWEQLIAQKVTLPPALLWLPVARAVAIASLLMGSGAYLLSALWGHLPRDVSFSGSASWANNLWTVSITLAPVLCVCTVRWCVSVFRGQTPHMISLSGGLSALSAAAITAISLPPAWPDTAIVFVQSAAWAVAGLAWLTIAWATLRNFVGLRKLTRGKTPARQLFPKAMKGQRWKQAEQASWSMVTLAFLSVLLLGATASGLVIAYPAQVLPGLHSIGGWFSAIVFAVTLSLYYWLAVKRGASRFGLLAVVLGLAAPLTAASLASFLVAHPQYKLITAADYEPYRLQLILWLVALFIGYIVRLLALRRLAMAHDTSGKVLNPLGEAAWILLATMVACLALVSTWNDPDPRWPLAELSGLALIGVLSGVAAGQAWRGHLAAVAAAAGLFAWLLEPSLWNTGLESLWCVLWGPVWVAGVGLIATLRLPVERRPQWSVDQSVSLHVPIASALLSFVWIVLQAPQSPSAADVEHCGIVCDQLNFGLRALVGRAPRQAGLGSLLESMGSGPGGEHCI